MYLIEEQINNFINTFAGGEPLIRRDVIHKAIAFHDTIFPIFTNGTLIDNSTIELAFSDIERRKLENCQQILRIEIPSMLFISFPGDEKSMGGCLAAGRGFFHINPYGEAEACPFSPYSDRNLQTSTLLKVLQSPFFRKLQESSLVGGDHVGGCTLFEKQDTVRDILQLVKE